PSVQPTNAARSLLASPLRAMRIRELGGSTGPRVPTHRLRPLLRRRLSESADIRWQESPHHDAARQLREIAIGGHRRYFCLQREYVQHVPVRLQPCSGQPGTDGYPHQLDHARFRHLQRRAELSPDLEYERRLYDILWNVFSRPLQLQ